MPGRGSELGGRWFGVRRDTRVEQDAGLLAHRPGVVPGLNDEDVPGSDRQLGTVIRAHRHLSGHADARVMDQARPCARDRLDVPGPLPTRLEGPSTQGEVPQGDHVEVTVGLELPGLVRNLDVA